MKNFLLILAGLCCFHLATFAQTNVSFTINHKLGAADFAFNKMAQNNMGENFEVTRLEYYMSWIQLTHDGGQVTSFPDLYLLVNASQGTNVDLGDHNITNLEKVSFYIGVNRIRNHLDPATFDASHALAPKNPSMHWGWTPGYRFVAMEGKSGANMSQGFELHGLGDGNYWKTEIPITTTAANGTLPIYLDADYTGVLHNIDLSSGPIVHGETDEARDAIVNFNNEVFSLGSPSTGVENSLELQSLSIFPNPTTNGKVTIACDLESHGDVQLMIVDALGRAVFESTATGTAIKTDARLSEPGLYILSVMKDGARIGSKKLMVQ